MRNQISLILQIAGLIMFFAGTITAKNSSITEFIISCITGLV